MRLTLSPLALALAATLSLGACSPASEEAAPAAESAQAGNVDPAAEMGAETDRDAQTDPMDAVLAGDWRDADNAARDAWRHPRETLAFFGVGPSQTIVEISPGGGWYTEILAALPGEKGSYVGVINDPAKSGNENARNYYTEANTKLRDKLAARADVYGEVTLVEIDPKAPVIGEPGSADVVLTFRNVHNWVMAGNEAAMVLGRDAFQHPHILQRIAAHRDEVSISPCPQRPQFAFLAQHLCRLHRGGAIRETRRPCHRERAEVAALRRRQFLHPRFSVAGIARALGNAGYPEPRIRAPGYTTLLRTIVGQCAQKPVFAPAFITD